MSEHRLPIRYSTLFWSNQSQSSAVSACIYNFRTFFTVNYNSPSFCDISNLYIAAKNVSNATITHKALKPAITVYMQPIAVVAMEAQVCIKLAPENFSPFEFFKLIPSFEFKRGNSPV